MLTQSNYYESKTYCSASQYKDFMGSHGRLGCEARALATWKGEWKPETTDAMLIGSYVDSLFEGTLEEFKNNHPEIYLKNGDLKAQYRQADVMIERILKDKFFLSTLSGEKQKIVTGEIAGVKFKGKLDSYQPGKAIVDLKTCQSIHKTEWVPDAGKLSWITYWGYDLQLAIYRELIRQETGESLPCFISAVTKEKYPDIAVIHIPDKVLDEAIIEVENNAYKIDELKAGATPTRCEQCDYCKSTKTLKAPVSLFDI